MYMVMVLRDGKPLGTPVENSPNNMIFESYKGACERAEAYKVKYKEETAIYRLVGPIKVGTMKGE